MALVLYDLGIVACLLAWIFFLWYGSRRIRYPPGPPGYPIIGNVLDVPVQNSWVRYRDLGREYGTDTLFLSLLGMPVLVLNSWEAASDLLEKRSSKYSDRPRTVMFHELTGWGRAFFLRDADSVWRSHRRAFHQYVNERAIVQYHAQTAKYTRRLLKRLLDKPEEFLTHIHWMTGALIIDIAYGFDVQSEEDPWLVASEKAMQGVARMAKAGAYFVDVFPVLKYLPSWFPGVKFKKDAAEYRASADAMFQRPLEAVKRKISAGTARPSVTSSLLSHPEYAPDKESFKDLVESVSGTMFSGGTDTVTSAIDSFTLAMVLHPDIQRAAQAELDLVVGNDRLPELADRDALPLVTAVIWEVLRWRPVGPLGVPHKLNADDEYKGYHIPAGTVVFANIWAILRDENTYPRPETFNPYRFLTTPTSSTHPYTFNKHVPLPDIAIFGFGRRICPGRFFGLNVVWLSIANMLATLSFEKRVDDRGRVVEPSGEYTHDMIVYPVPFPAEIRPRSKAAEELVRAAALADLE